MRHREIKLGARLQETRLEFQSGSDGSCSRQVHLRRALNVSSHHFYVLESTLISSLSSVKACFSAAGSIKAAAASQQNPQPGRQTADKDEDAGRCVFLGHLDPVVHTCSASIPSIPSIPRARPWFPHPQTGDHQAEPQCPVPPPDKQSRNTVMFIPISALGLHRSYTNIDSGGAPRQVRFCFPGRLLVFD